MPREMPKRFDGGQSFRHDTRSLGADPATATWTVTSNRSGGTGSANLLVYPDRAPGSPTTWYVLRDADRSAAGATSPAVTLTRSTTGETGRLIGTGSSPLAGEPPSQCGAATPGGHGSPWLSRADLRPVELVGRIVVNAP